MSKSVDMGPAQKAQPVHVDVVKEAQQRTDGRGSRRAGRMPRESCPLRYHDSNGEPLQPVQTGVVDFNV